MRQKDQDQGRARRRRTTTGKGREEETEQTLEDSQRLLMDGQKQDETRRWRSFALFWGDCGDRVVKGVSGGRWDGMALAEAVSAS